MWENLLNLDMCIIWLGTVKQVCAVPSDTMLYCDKWAMWYGPLWLLWYLHRRVWIVVLSCTGQICHTALNSVKAACVWYYFWHLLPSTANKEGGAALHVSAAAGVAWPGQNRTPCPSHIEHKHDPAGLNSKHHPASSPVPNIHLVTQVLRSGNQLILPCWGRYSFLPTATCLHVQQTMVFKLCSDYWSQKTDFFHFCKNTYTAHIKSGRTAAGRHLYNTAPQYRAHKRAIWNITMEWSLAGTRSGSVVFRFTADRKYRT